MSRPVYPIRFPLVKEPTKWRRGPRFFRVPDQSGLYGARGCAAGMIAVAVHKRDLARFQETDPLNIAFVRASMRTSALWARVFAGHMEAKDPRVVEAQAAHSRAGDAIITRAQSLDA